MRELLAASPAVGDGLEHVDPVGNHHDLQVAVAAATQQTRIDGRACQHKTLAKVTRHDQPVLDEGEVAHRPCLLSFAMAAGGVAVHGRGGGHHAEQREGNASDSELATGHDLPPEGVKRPPR